MSKHTIILVAAIGLVPACGAQRQASSGGPIAEFPRPEALAAIAAVEMTYKPYDDIPITISHLKKDGLFGWSAVVGSEKYTSSAIAIENLEALRVRGSELRRLCVEHPEAGKEILERLASSVSSRVQDAQEQVKSILKQGMKNK